MLISELFVRVRGDVSDADRAFKRLDRGIAGVEGSTKRLNATMGQGALQTGRLGNQFAGLAGQLTGIHPIIGNVAGVLGNFAVGSALTVGVLGGLAAIALAYDVLTKSTREATKVQDEAVKSLLKSRHLKIVGGGVGENVLQARSKLNALLAEGTRLQKELDANRGVLVLEAQTLEKIAANQEEIHAVQQAIIHGKQELATGTNAATTSTVKLKDTYMDLRDAAAKVNAEATKANADWWRGYIERTGEALTLTEQLNQAILADRPGLLEVYRDLMTQGTPGAVSMPNVSMPFEGLTEKQKENLRELGVIKDDANRNADQTREAIWGAAIQSANIIAGALNIGGGGRGSGIGGALGGAIGGAALGGKLGAFGGPIGAVVGAIAGSFIGGLFDHKKAVDTNTAAVRQNTAALMLHAPAGYKTGGIRYDATELKDFRRGLQRSATRGGAPILVTP